MPESSFTDAIALLKADRRTVEGLFDQFEKARSDEKRALAEQICNELKIHAQIEEEIFYPARREARHRPVDHNAGPSLFIEAGDDAAGGVSGMAGPLAFMAQLPPIRSRAQEAWQSSRNPTRRPVFIERKPFDPMIEE